MGIVLLYIDADPVNLTCLTLVFLVTVLMRSSDGDEINRIKKKEEDLNSWGEERQNNNIK